MSVLSIQEGGRDAPANGMPKSTQVPPAESQKHSAASGLNEHHLRRIRVTFQCVDDRLNEIEFVLANAGLPSPFKKHADDSTPIQRKIVHDYIIRLRETMRRILAELDVPLSPPVCGALWAASTSVLFASIDIEEMDASHMKGFGPLSGEAAKAIETICAEMKSILGRLTSFLSDGTGGDFQARLAKLEQTGDEVRLLQELERIVTAHGLVEFRGALAMILDRMETETFEIGLFGRVSSGKSSLLDYLLETNALPVGVTPVTAVPTRVSHGRAALARIEFSQSETRIIDLSALSEYATEQQNPGNEKRVSRIEVEIPAWRLRDGIVFVDTPGLGSLPLVGANETYAYLPHCDLGIVLVDANSGLTAEDLQVLQALSRTGATAMVLLSKADLLDPEDRVRMIDYVGKHLREQAGLATSIHAVSVVGADAGMCERWWHEEMKPRMERNRELAVITRRRKTGALRESVIAALELRRRAGDTSGLERVASGDVDHALVDAECALDMQPRETWNLSHAIADCPTAIVAILAAKLAHAWTESAHAEAGRFLSETFNEVLAEPIAAFPRCYEALRSKLAGALPGTAGSSEDSAAAALPRASGLPVFDSSSFTGQLLVNRPNLLRFFGEGVLAHHLRGEIEKQLGTELRSFLCQYGRRLRKWMDHAVKDLKTAFDAAADIHRAKSAPVDGDVATNHSVLEHDLTLLQNWPSRTQIQEDLPAADVPQTGNGVCLPATPVTASRLITPTSPTKTTQL